MQAASGDSMRVPRPAPQRRTTRVPGRAYSYFVMWMKVLLPAMALGLVLLMLAWPRFTDTTVVTPIEDDGRLEMEGARFVGTDSENRPYSVDADSAIQSSNDQGVVDLVQPQAEMTLTDGSWVALHADRGRFNQETGKMLLMGGVAVFHDAGYEFRSDEAHVDTNAGLAWSDRPVEGQGPFGTIRASGFRLIDEGRTIVFVGEARLNLTSATPQPDAPGPDAGSLEIN